MSRDEQKRIKNIATGFINQIRTKEEIVKTFQNAGILDKNGKVKAPYNEILIPAKK